MKQFLSKKVIAVFFFILGCTAVLAQGTQVSFGSIPKSGTALVYSHLDDDLIWMLPFWNITEKFIGGAMPSTPWYDEIIREQQVYLNANGYSISYQSNWYTPWAEITDQQYSEYYLNNNPAYHDLVLDHLETRMYNDPNEMSAFEISKLKAKIEQYIASADVSRIITHNNWGEYGHMHHKAVNKAVRELAVKYRKDVWMLGCNNERFVDVAIPNGITYAMGSFNDPTLYNSIRNIYEINNRWTWYTDRTPSGDHAFIKIVEAGVDKSNILTGESVTYSGPAQNQPGAYIFDGEDDYLTLNGNNYPSFTIAMRVRPDQIRSMDISKMTEYPSNTNSDRNFYMNSDGTVSARINDGSSKVATSSTVLTAGTWSHIVMTSNGSSLKIYVNGNLENTISAGTAGTGYASPEFVLGQTALTSSYFSGQINDVRLFNYALTENEVASLSGVVYTIDANAGTGGSINPTGPATVIVGANKSYAITANNGYYISDVKVDNNSVGAVSTFTFNHVISNHTISATFNPITFVITASAGTGGTISPSGEVTVNSGTNRTFNITPGNGFKIIDVKVDNISAGTVSSYTFSNVTSNHIISATFAPLVTYTITSSAGPGGSINPLGILTVGGGTNQTYVITPDIGYRIADVTIDDIPSGAIATYTFNNITANHTISVTFSVTPTYTITSGAGTGGSIDPNGTVTVNEASNQTFLISPNSGYRISEVLVDNNPVGALSNYTFSNITSNHTISASFSPIPAYSITASSGAGGSIDPSGTVTVYEGANRSFTFSANFGYQISDVKVDNNSMGIMSSYTFNNIIANHTINVSFALVTYTITGSAGAGGSISPSGILTLNHGTNQTYNITTNTGYRISDVKVDNNSIGAVSTYTFNNVTSNHTISATFSIINYTITGTAGTGGTINPQGAVIVNYGTSKTFSINTNIGYNVSDVLIDDVSVGPVSSYTFNNVRANHTIIAEFTPVTYTITSTAGANGSISPGGVLTVDYGTGQTFSINPDYGFQVSNVRVDNSPIGAVSSYTFNNILSDHTLSATFEVATYTINASAGAGGSITPAGIITLNHGTSQTYTITPNTGYRISDVEVDNRSTGTGSTFAFNNVTANHTISVTFAIITYTITESSGTGGLISPQGESTVNYGTNQTFSISPSTGYDLSDVRIDDVSVGAVSTYTFNNVLANHTISATFSLKTFTITGSSGPDGSVTPGGIITVNYGTGRIYSITPNIGYHISDVKVDNNSVGAVSTYTFSNITTNHTISATFVINTYTITGSSGRYGLISPAGVITLEYGMNRVYTITPDPGYQITDVLVDNISAGPVSTYTFNSVSANHTISATFSIITYKITASAGTGGSITPAGIANLDYGMSRTYTITPATGFQLSGLKVDNISVDPVLTYTFNNVTANHTISATFSLITYTIRGDVIKGEEGSISPAGTVKVDYGTNQTYTIIPVTGFKILDIIVDNISMGALTSYTFRNVTTDHTISAKFTPITFTITGSSGSNGSISTEGISTVIYGTNQSYDITPDIGYQVSEVMIDNTSAGAPLSYTFQNITNNHTISVTFSRSIYTLEGSASAGGTISPGGTQTMYYGSDRMYTFTPDENYRISDVKVDNISLGPVPSYTFNNVTANHTIAVVFKPLNTYLITATAGTGGTISPSGTINLFEGSNQSYTITPGKGYRISDVEIDNIPAGVLSDYTFNDLMSDHIISATFTTKIEANVYPNPFKDHIKIMIISPVEEFFDISIVDLSQKVVFTKTKIPGNTENVIYLQHTPPGIYILKLFTKDNRITTFRIVKY